MGYQTVQRFKSFPLARSTSLTILFQWILFAVVLLHSCIGAVNGNASPESVNDDANPINYGEKRSWQSLQGAWGKRSLDAGISAELTEGGDDVYFAERRVPLPFSIGGHLNPVLKYSLVYLKNGGDLLSHMENGDSEIGLDARLSDDNLAALYDAETENADTIGNALSPEKRAWKSMNVAWGKRRNAPQWNKFRGAWGKREPGWNNLKGMWGKRSSKDWQKLHGSWGKRTPQTTMDAN